LAKQVAARTSQIGRTLNEAVSAWIEATYLFRRLKSVDKKAVPDIEISPRG
jgi:hypothetical protein